MKKVIKWVCIVMAGLLVLTVAFTAVFIVIPLSRSITNLQEKQEESVTAVTQTAEPENETAAPAAEETATASLPEETTVRADAEAGTPTEYDIYRSGHLYITGTVTDSSGQTNPMEMAITDQSVYMVTTSSGVELGVMIGGGKTYLVSPAHRAYIELSKTVLSMLGLDAEKIAAPTSFNFSDMRPLSEADAVNEAELDGAACTEYVFNYSDGTKTCVYMSGTRLLRTDTFKADGQLSNRMTFESVSAEVPSNRVAPPTYYDKKGLLGFISLLSKEISG